VRDHPLGALLDADQSAQRVDVHDRVPVVLGHVEQVHRPVETGVVEEDVELAQLVGETVQRRGDLGPHADVRGEGDRLSPLRPDGCGDRLGGIGVSVEHSDRGSFAGQAERERATHPAARTGDDDPLAGDATVSVLHACLRTRARSGRRIRGWPGC
jgi:hypothetical protein